MTHRFQRIAARLGLFAMLMVFLGPLIGQGAAHAHAEQTHIRHSAMADMDCGPMPGMSGISAAEHHGMALWEQCGYCSLLFQHPPLIESSLPGFVLSMPARACLVGSPVVRRTAPPVFPGSRARAPPLIR